MAQLTWRNVDAPNFSGAAAGYKAFSDLIGNASTAASTAIGAYDDTTRMDAANPGIQAYFQAAAQGDPNAAKAALAQHSAAFGNLRPDQLAGVLGAGGKMTNTSIGNQGDYFKNMLGQRDDIDKQAAIGVLNQVGSQIGNNTDVYGVLANNEAFRRMNPTQQQMVKAGLQGQGWQFQGPSGMGAGAPGAGSASSSLGSGNPATAAIGGAVGSFGVRDNLWNSTLKQESGGSHTNKDGSVKTSTKGARGIAQVMPGTAPEAARLAGLTWDEDKYNNDSGYNETIGRAYMGKQLQTFGGDEIKALAAYNAGPGRVSSLIAKHGDNWLSHAPAETQDYVKRITSNISNDPATGLVNAARPQNSPTLAAKSASNDLVMANALQNSAPYAKLFEAAKDTKTSTAELAKRLADTTGAPIQELNQKIGEIVSDYPGVPASVAAAILENGGLGRYTGDGFLWNKGIRGWLKDEGRWGDAWRPNDVEIKKQAGAFLGPDIQNNARVNDSNAALDAALASAREAHTAAIADHKRLQAAAMSNPDLRKHSIPAAEGRLQTATAQLERVTKAQQNSPQAQQKFPENDGNMPKAAKQKAAADAAPEDAGAELTKAYQARLKQADLPKSALLGYLLGQ